MSTPRVSVIVPAYNAADTLEACLASLRAQTLEDIEIVIVDDGSSDGTVAIARAEGVLSPDRVRAVSQPHAGRAAARNRGIAESRGEFLGFVDADDTAEPEMYEVLLARAKESGADLVVGEYVGVDAHTGEVLYPYPEGDSALYGTSVADQPDLLLQPGASVCNKLIGRSLFERTGIRFPEGLDFEDLATAYRLAGEASRIEKVDRVVYRYRQGLPTSVMASCDERYLEIVPALVTTNEHFRSHDRLEELRGQLEEINFIHLISGRLDDLLRYGTATVRRRFTRAAYAHMDTYFPGWRRDPRIRAVCGKTSKHLVCTNECLLTLYTDSKAVRRR